MEYESTIKKEHIWVSSDEVDGHKTYVFSEASESERGR